MTIRDGALGSLRLRMALAGLGLAAVACQPTVRVEPPKEPIVVNLNVKIEHEVRIKVEKDVEALFEDNPDLF